MANVEIVELRRAENLRRNLCRIFSTWGNQTRVAKDAQIHRVHLAQILKGKALNPTIGTIESLSVALEIPVETLLSLDPSDVDLRIPAEKNKIGA